MYKRKFIENKITDISLEQVKLMDDDEKILLLSNYPYESLYKNKEVFQWLSYWIARNQGKYYQQTGSKRKSFSKKGIF